MQEDGTPPLVLIEWLDSGQPVSAWQWLEEIRHRRPHRCVSVGFLVQDDAQAKVLAPNLAASDTNESFDQASGLTTIPATAVVRVAELRAPGAGLCSPAPEPPDLGLRHRLVLGPENA